MGFQRRILWEGWSRSSQDSLLWSVWFVVKTTILYMDIPMDAILNANDMAINEPRVPPYALLEINSHVLHINIIFPN